MAVTFVGVGAYALNRAQALAGDPNAQVISFLVPPQAHWGERWRWVAAERHGWFHASPGGEPQLLCGVTG